MKDFLIDPLLNLEQYNKLLSDIKGNISPISTYGIIDENLGHFAYAIKKHTQKQLLIITYDEVKSKSIYEDLKGLGMKDAVLFPKRELILYDVDAVSTERSNERLRVLAQLSNKDDLLVVTSINSVMDKILCPEVFRKHTQIFEFGKEIDLEDCILSFVNAGYERVHMVEGIGQFSIRGGIIDFFPPDSLNPYRIELFDTEIDSIRTFDMVTQRSIENVQQVKVPPVKEILITDEFKKSIISNLEKDLKKNQKKSEDSKKNSNEKFEKYIQLLNENMYMENRDLIIPYIPNDFLSDILSYFQDDFIILMDEPKRIEASHSSFKDDYNLRFTDLFEIGEVLSSHTDIYHDFNRIIERVRDATVVTSSAMLKANQNLNPKSIINFAVKSMGSYHSKMEILKDDLNHYKYRGYKIIILSGNEERGVRLRETLMDMEIESVFSADRDTEIKSGQLLITPGSIKAGFEYNSLKLAVISDKEIFGGSRKKAAKKKSKNSKTINITDLNVGDFIVHENYGIGQYQGIEQLNIQGIKKDFLAIQYKGKDRLYLSIDQMNLIQKYIGSDEKPKINKLNSGEWSKSKAKAKKAVEEMAYDLLELYAKREKIEGYAFGADTPWQRQFEDSFPYEETDGQISSIEEIKVDMEKPRPMDRLLCGDVGYGKTEVALRAAFKALMDGKQVAILVPTTILAQQHYNTIYERFEGFPVKTALLSRFRNAQEQKASIEGLRKGTIDLVVGTHRLLSKDVKFKDLGLLIIDEEQRFGVKHKETLKKLKEMVDVLTLTATPIPRTLHMSMIGIRDMSVIEDPPEERYPIQTYVVEYNPQMIRDAILREISRGGQVYFLYNRVETIDQMASKLRDLVPEASFSVGHGQMGERQLEKVMLDFLDRKHDVLICTTIIETGLDIPNVNTIIIFDSDKMGLSQLYQLRGRVGRSNRIAYGYFTYERDKVLSEVAEKRLRAIKEFTDFGSGFKIAMRDLEIRGAGNLIGLQQHGHIESIGYDLYVKYLGQAIRRLRGEEIKETTDTSIDLKVDGFIPRRYIQDEEQKIEIYKKISSIESKDEYNELFDELVDRFGDVPDEVVNLMEISFVRHISSKLHIKNVVQLDKEIRLDFESVELLSLELIEYLSKEYGRKLRFDLSTNPHFYLLYKNSLDDLKKLLEKITGFIGNKNNI